VNNLYSYPLMMEALPPFSLNYLSKNEKRFVKDCVDVLYAILSIYGFESKGAKRLGTYNHWIYCSSLCSPLKFVKYKIAAFFSFWKATISDEEAEMPPSPVPLVLDNPSVILGGRAYRFCRNMSRSDVSRFNSLIVSILYSKKGMPRPPMDLVRKAELDAFDKLTTPCPNPQSVLLPNSFGKENVQVACSVYTLTEQIKRTVREILGPYALSASEKLSLLGKQERFLTPLERNELLALNNQYTDRDRFTPFFPSTSANYINTRSLGGAVGTLLTDPEILSGLTVDESEQLIKIDLKMKSSLNVTGDSSVPFIQREIQHVTVDTVPLENRFRILYKRILEKALAEEPVAVPLGLPEALKVRVITKGPPFCYTAMKPIQKKLHSIMRHMRIFQLIGKPVDGNVLQDVLGAKLAPGTAFLSIDYSDATNELFSYCSEAAWEEISRVWQLSGTEYLVGLKSLTLHNIQNPETVRSMKSAKSLVAQLPLPDDILRHVQSFLPDFVSRDTHTAQLRGQLMGSILSFPILCIVNAAVCRWAMEFDRDQVLALKDLPLLINGDDGVFKCSPAGLEAWEVISSLAGLSPSPGKVYYSRRFLNINSTQYEYSAAGLAGFAFSDFDRECPRMFHFAKTQYVNMGLLHGLKRSGGQFSLQDTNTHVTIGSRVRDLVSSCPVELRQRVLGQFIHLNSKVLFDAQIPWFIPEHLGGLGFPILPDSKVPDRDLRLARKIFDHPDKYPLPGKLLDVPWQTWKLVQKRFSIPRSFFIQDIGAYQNKDSSSDLLSLNRLLGLACVELLFKKSLSSLYKTKEVSRKESAVRNYFRRISKVWRRALLDDSISLPEPFNSENFPRSTDMNGVKFMFRVDTTSLVG
jgi:hypothetical protein